MLSFKERIKSFRLILVFFLAYSLSESVSFLPSELSKQLSSKISSILILQYLLLIAPRGAVFWPCFGRRLELVYYFPLVVAHKQRYDDLYFLSSDPFPGNKVTSFL